MKISWDNSYILVLALFFSGALGSGHFGYDAEDVLGPEHWSVQFKECAGKYQSPIDIDERLVKRVRLPPLSFSGIRDLPWVGLLQNDGHTVKLRINSTGPLQMSGGPLKGKYTFEQLHFHWGVNDSAGSEDLINHRSFPMELHMVYYKAKYKSFERALDYKDGLAVLALFFEISNYDNKAYSELVDSLKTISFPDTDVELPYLLPLEFYLPPDRQHYFTYNGSLTTPPCLEVVTWIEFKHPVLLSHRQLEQFRHLRSEKGLLTHNARPLQPLHGRRVLYNVEDRSSAYSLKSLSKSIVVLLSSIPLLLAYYKHT